MVGGVCVPLSWNAPSNGPLGVGDAYNTARSLRSERKPAAGVDACESESDMPAPPGRRRAVCAPA